MPTRDWALVVFTLLSQAAVGAFLTLFVLSVRARRAGFGRGAIGAVFAVMAASLLASLSHLATPWLAPRAILNFSTSWLSREVVFGGLFAALLALLVALEWRFGPPVKSSPLVAWAAVFAGLAFVYSQSRLYMVPSQPAWDGPATPAAFAASALRLGILGVAVGMLAGGRGAIGSGDESSGASSKAATVRALVAVGVVAVVAELLILPLHLASLTASASPAARESAHLLTVDFGAVLALRLILLCVGAVTLAGVLIASRSSLVAGRGLLYAAFGTVVISEVCGRFLFYATQVRVGI